MEREEILKIFHDPEERLLAARILDKIEQVKFNGRPQLTDFLDPAQQEAANLIARQEERVSYILAGGYRQAERKRLALMPKFYHTELLDPEIRFLAVEGDFRGTQVSHRDLLGSILGLGIKREKVGDIIMTATGGQVAVTGEILDFVKDNLKQVHRFPVQVREIDPEQLAVEPERTKEIRASVASLRLDAVASSGYGTSRTQMVREIKAGHVKVNWRVVDDASSAVKAGDVLSMRGRGRLVIEEVRGETKKGRTSLLLRRYY